MHSDGASRRFCDVCSKHVHDLSAMTEATARTVLADERAKGRVCVRYTVDATGTIKFRPETVEAPSLWRMTLAAAGMAMALLTGCADAEPDRVLSDKCVHEVGPWSFTTQRGEGTCPAVEPEQPEPLIMGEIEAVIEPPPPVEPIHELKGDVAPPEPEWLGEASPDPLDLPEPPPERQIMGKIPRKSTPDPLDVPCDPPEREGPRRI